MIIGNGLIAKSLNKIDLDNYIFFASGVSNSNCVNDFEFRRELDKIKNFELISKSQTFVYFSSCLLSLNMDNLNSYYSHKRDIEQYIISNFKNFLILRLPQVVGNSNNKNTLINNFIYKIQASQKIEILENSTRYFLDVNKLTCYLDILIKKNIKNEILDIFYPKKYSIIEVVKILENCLNMKANLNIVKGGIDYDLKIPNYFKGFEKDIDTQFDYLENCIYKYFI